ncbi:ribosome biogenesis GTP-binding protein YihA/YsxC [Radicibacter daui]|uniref:ribosome biogenesis GTP-binding protein YihA/YsxC n=1 Tax=Radicibacter daui TaxID=3064829 RepID=UPI004046C069
MELDAAEKAAREEAGRLLFARECTFMLGVAELFQLPPEKLPEVAFVGRSNVGKSSLVNALTGRKTLARVSNTPGRTQQINYFDLGGRLHLVDLPGYGFAEAPKGMVEAWTKMMRTFLRGRVPLRRVCLLVDGRHGCKKNDIDMMKMLDESAVQYQVVLTKADKMKPAAMSKIAADTRALLVKHPAASPDPVVTSSETGEGIAHLRGELGMLAAPA